jgi:hypothetical protein
MGAKKKFTKKSRRNIVFGIIALTVFVSLGFIFSGSKKKAPDPANLSQENAVKYMASNKFASLPEKQKELFIKKLRDKSNDAPPHKVFASLSQEERKALHKNMGKLMHRKMKERIKKFFAMTPEEQDAFLDQEIERMRERHEKERESGDGGRPQGPPPDGGDHASRMQGMLENTDSTSRAQMHEFHRRLHERAQSRSN